MLPRAQRLSGEKPFKTLFTKGKSVFGSSLKMKFLVTAHHPPQFAVSVSTKISKEAVIRNRIRRRIFAALREILKESPFCHLSAVLIVLPATETLTKEDWKEELIQLFQKARVRLCDACRTQTSLELSQSE